MSLKDYVEVKTRLKEFYEKHPDGSIASTYEYRNTGTRLEVVVTASAYRDREDQRPAIGLASEQIPGLTNFNNGSELEVAQTSAWGRALGALGIGVNGGVASREEVESAQARTSATPTLPPANTHLELHPGPVIKRVSHSDQAIPEFDPWQTPAPVDNMRPAVAVVEEMLGGTVIGGVKYTDDYPQRLPDTHGTPPTPKQLGFTQKLVREGAAQVGVDEIAYLNAVLGDIGFPEVTDWASLGRGPASKVIDKLKAGK